MFSPFGRKPEFQSSSTESRHRNLIPLVGLLTIATLLTAACAPATPSVPPTPTAILQADHRIDLDCMWGAKTGEALFSDVQPEAIYAVNGDIGFKIGENGLMAVSVNPVRDSSFKSFAQMNDGRTLVINTRYDGGNTTYTATLKALEDWSNRLNIHVAAACNK